MEKERSIRILSIIAICISLVGVSIGFATFSTTLNIEGVADVKKASWEVKFIDLQDAELSGTATEVTKPTINNENTTISNYKINLKKPGDSATYKFKVKNNGTFDAKISSINIPTPVCTGVGEKASTDEINVCNNLTYILTYANGDPLEENDTLLSGEYKELVLTLNYISFKDDTLLPNNDVAISNLDITLSYVQNS